MSIDMFTTRIPLNQLYFHHRLSAPATEARKGFAEAKIPVTETFFPMGTIHPTGRFYLI